MRARTLTVPVADSARARRCRCALAGSQALQRLDEELQLPFELFRARSLGRAQDGEGLRGVARLEPGRPQGVAEPGTPRQPRGPLERAIEAVLRCAGRTA